MTNDNKTTETVISFVLCSRNDNYMGDSMWRLASSINYLSEGIYDLNLEAKTEIILTDWGSEIPIAEVIQLTQKSTSLCKILEVPKTLADDLQGDSPFAEVFALNAAVRRSKGAYIARIDQDTLVTKKFLSGFFRAYGNPESIKFSLSNAYMFAARKQFLFSFVEKKPSLGDLGEYIKLFGKSLLVEELPYCFWASAVGILMAHRSVWNSSGGYDERLKYYWYMDVDLGTRLIKKYPIINIGKVFGYEFYHLEHFPIKKTDGSKSRASHRKKNPDWARSFVKPVLNPNGENWGLANYDIKTVTVKDSYNVKIETTELVKRHLSWNKRFFNIYVVCFLKWIIYKMKYAYYYYKKLTNKLTL